MLDATAANLRHGFLGAITAAAQCGRAEPVATRAEWAATGWQPRPGKQETVWLAVGRGTLQRATVMLPASQLIPARPGTAPAVPGTVPVAAGADIPGALTAFARHLGYPVTGDPPSPGPSPPVIYAPAGQPPELRAAVIAHHLAHIKLGEPEALMADCAGEPAIIADSVAWLVLRRLGVTPAAAGIRFPPPSLWAPTPDHMVVAGTRITRTAASITRHAEMVLSALPPRPAGQAPARPAGRPDRADPARPLAPDTREAGQSRAARPSAVPRGQEFAPPRQPGAPQDPARAMPPPRAVRGQAVPGRAAVPRRAPAPPAAAANAMNAMKETRELVASLCRAGRHSDAARTLSHLPEEFFPQFLIPGAVAALGTADLIKVHRLLAAPSPSPDTGHGPSAGPARDACARLLIPRVNEAAAAWFTGQLPGSWAEGYLDGRGITPAMRGQWELGYAPKSAGQTKLLNHLRKEGWGDALALAAGLAYRTPTGTQADMFRDRVIIPIRDDAGTLVAFAGRCRPDAAGDPPKYINTAANPAYAKGDVLYGLYQARQVLAAGGQPVLVEGYSDVWAVNACGGGMLAGVASCGTALTAAQMEALAGAVQRHGHDLREAPLLDVRDADSAGQKAAARDYALIIPWCPQPRAAALPAETDPAEVFEKDGPQVLARALTDNDHPLADVAVDAVLDDWDRSWTRPDGGKLLEETGTAIGAVYAAARLLAATGTPTGEVARQVARMARRTQLPWSFVDWAVRRETDPACPDEPPDDPSGGLPEDQVRAMAERDEGRQPARTMPPGQGGAVTAAAFPQLPGGPPPQRTGRRARAWRTGHDPPARRAR